MGVLHCSEYTSIFVRGCGNCMKPNQSHVPFLTTTTTYLTGGGYVPGDVFHCHWVLYIESVALTLHPSFVHQHTSISCQASKCQCNMLIKTADLAYCSGILKLSKSPLFYCQNNSVLATNCNL